MPVSRPAHTFLDATNGFFSSPSLEEALKNARRDMEERGKRGAASVDDGDIMDEGGSAGPPLPAGQEFGEDDDEGRFFGGGVSERQAEILDFMDEQEMVAAVRLYQVHNESLVI